MEFIIQIAGMIGLLVLILVSVLKISRRILTKRADHRRLIDENRQYRESTFALKQELVKMKPLVEAYEQESQKHMTVLKALCHMLNEQSPGRQLQIRFFHEGKAVLLGETDSGEEVDVEIGGMWFSCVRDSTRNIRDLFPIKHRPCLRFEAK